ncbi:MAG: hypothetical protein WCQ57_04475 [Verrucomicrobiota bacterium]
MASALSDCRRNFGERDSGGRKRIDYISEYRLPGDIKGWIIRDAEEI